MRNVTKILLTLAGVLIILLGTTIIHIRTINTLSNQISQIQTPKFIVSDEPERISKTLTKAYPYIKIWGKDVVYYWSCIIYDQCQKRNLDWEIVCAKIHCESGFNPKAISDRDAKGMAQMLDSTAVITGRKIGITYVPGVTLWNDISSMILGIEYLDQQIKREKSVINGLKSYNGGPGWRKSKKLEDITEYGSTVTDEAFRLSTIYGRLYPERNKNSFLRTWKR